MVGNRPVIQSGCVGVGGKGDSVHICHFGSLDSNPNGRLQGVPGGEGHSSPDGETPTQISVNPCVIEGLNDPLPIIDVQG